MSELQKNSRLRGDPKARKLSGTMELVRQVVAKPVHMTYAPILPALGSAFESFGGGIYLITLKIGQPELS